MRNGYDVAIVDLDAAAAAPLLDAGAGWRRSPADLARDRDLVITCLPSPSASAAVVDGHDGLLQALRPGAVWAEMSTTDEAEVRRLAARLADVSVATVDCPVSGGCHRSATGNIAIFTGCERAVFDRVLPVLTTMGRRVLHTGPVGSASVLKVVTNYLATASLVALAEALVTASAAGMDLATTYEAIRISSGNSFVHETKGQVILNGSRDISFTMDLVCKDLGLFQAVADRCAVPLELSPLLGGIFDDAQARHGPRSGHRTSSDGSRTPRASTFSRPASRRTTSTTSRRSPATRSRPAPSTLGEQPGRFMPCPTDPPGRRRHDRSWRTPCEVAPRRLERALTEPPQPPAGRRRLDDQDRHAPAEQRQRPGRGPLTQRQTAAMPASASCLRSAPPTVTNARCSP